MTKRTLTVLMAVLTALCLLSGCQKMGDALMEYVRSTPEPTATPTPVPTPTPIPTPTPVPTPVPQGFSTSERGLHSDLHGVEIISYGQVTEPVNGIFWLQRNGADISLLSAIGLDGTLYFTTEDAVVYASDFNEEGQALLTLAEGRVSRRGDGAYRIDELERAIDYIVDTSGTVLYSPAWQGEWDEEILCSGNGRFLTLRHGWPEGQEVWLLGTLYADGTTADPFLPIVLPEEAGDFSPEQIRKTYETYSTALQLHRDPCYIGNGWFSVPGELSGLLYHPETGTFRYFELQRVLTVLDGDRFFGLSGGDLCTFDPESGAVQKIRTMPADMLDQRIALGTYCLCGTDVLNTDGATVFSMPMDKYLYILPAGWDSRVLAAPLSESDTGLTCVLIDVEDGETVLLADLGWARDLTYIPLDSVDWVSETWIACEGHLSPAAWSPAD